MWVLDASALLASLLLEPGSEVVSEAVPGAIMSAVNYSEVMKKTIERGGDAGTTASFVQRMAIDIVPFDAEQAVASAVLYLTTKAHGMSFADRACLALGIARRMPVMTAERRMGDVSLPIDVKVIRDAKRRA